MTASYEARIRRARDLKQIYPFAAEILTFYESVCRAQERIALAVERDGGYRKMAAKVTPETSLREQIDVDLLTPLAGEILTDLGLRAPEQLAESIREYLRGPQPRLAASLQAYVERGGTDEGMEDSREELFARVLVGPYAELLAAKRPAPSGSAGGNLCPQCAARPVAGVLRIEGEGGKRLLLCSFCGTEWDFRRIVCAYCGESREASLPVYVAEKFPQVRVEGCDTCRHCLRTVDLTKDGHAVPVVDDLAAIPLGLWADEYGYQRIRRNLLGT